MAEFCGFLGRICEGFFEWSHFGAMVAANGDRPPSVAARLPFIGRVTMRSNLSGIPVARFVQYRFSS
jgi:hypothetical protein